MTLPDYPAPLTSAFCLLVASTASLAASPFLDDPGRVPIPIESPTPAAFSVCHSHSCQKVTNTGLTTEEWRQVRQIFIPSAKSAEAERRQIGEAIAYLERTVGRKIGTDKDRARNFSWHFGSGGSQLDCIDESTNSTTYMTLMANDGLLQWHRVSETETRGFVLFGWPHTTAVIQEKRNGNQWAVDSWFYDNGQEPAILPLSVWADGWEPEDSR